MMKQSVYTVSVVVTVVLLAVALLLSLFGKTPFEFGFNLFVYVLAVFGVLVSAPSVLGYYAPKLIKLGDDKFGRKGENIPSGWHWVIGPSSAIAVAYCWMVGLVPLLSKLPQLSVWAVEIFKFRQVYEVPAWPWFVATGILYLGGYAWYFINKEY